MVPIEIKQFRTLACRHDARLGEVGFRTHLDRLFTFNVGAQWYLELSTYTPIKLRLLSSIANISDLELYGLDQTNKLTYVETHPLFSSK